MAISKALDPLVVSFASYLAWFWLLRHYWASRLGVFSFLTPLFGIAFGVGLLDEPVETSFLVGALLVLVGVMLVSGDDAWNALRGWLVRPGDNTRAAGDDRAPGSRPGKLHAGQGQPSPPVGRQQGGPRHIAAFSRTDRRPP